MFNNLTIRTVSVLVQKSFFHVALYVCSSMCVDTYYCIRMQKNKLINTRNMHPQMKYCYENCIFLVLSRILLCRIIPLSSFKHVIIALV